MLQYSKKSSLYFSIRLNICSACVLCLSRDNYYIFVFSTMGTRIKNRINIKLKLDVLMSKSLFANLNQIKLFVSHFDILMISKIWLAPDADQRLEVLGYVFIHLDTPT